jgi:hypothetical protein
VRLGDGEPVEAAPPAAPGRDWIALLPLGGLGPGVTSLAIEATATAAEVAPAAASAELLLGDAGVQLTDFATVGSADTPRLQWHDGTLYLTWTDRRAGDSEAWLVELDGAARFAGEPRGLVGADEETLQAVTAFGESSIAVLYQALGGPYRNFLKIVDLDGAELMAPLALDPEGRFGSFGGDVVFDGAAFVAVYRVNDGAGGGEVMWVRVDEATQEVTGPAVVATSGPATDADRDGVFGAFSFVDVEALGDRSLVGFVRGRYNPTIDMEVPKAQLALVGPDGAVLETSFASANGQGDLCWARECRVFPVEGGAAAVWSSANLLDPAELPPNLFRATLAGPDGALDAARGTGTVMFDQVDDRDEPFLLAGGGPGRLGVLAWFDHRAYTLEPERGGIELYAAPVADDLTVDPSTEIVFPHARIVAGTSLLWAAAAGSNVLLLWVDERHGLGIADPRPEIYFETVWF